MEYNKFREPTDDKIEYEEEYYDDEDLNTNHFEYISDEDADTSDEDTDFEMWEDF